MEISCKYALKGASLAIVSKLIKKKKKKNLKVPHIYF